LFINVDDENQIIEVDAKILEEVLVWK
jgi:hypothetical protein